MITSLSLGAPQPHRADALSRQIVSEENKYLRRFRNYALLGAGSYLIGAFTVWISTQSSLTNARDLSTPIAFRNDVSSGTALASAATLASVIIALQVAVRSALGEPVSRASAIARQRVLANVAHLCGIAAIGLGLTVTLSDWPPSVGDIWHTYAPLGGSLVLAFLAADASFASENQLGEAVNRRRLAEAIARQRMATVRLSSLPAARKSMYFLQVAIAIAVSLGCPLVVLALVDGSASGGEYVATGFAALFSLAIAGGYGGSAWLLVLRRELFLGLGSYLLCACILFFLFLTLSTAMLSHAADDVRYLAIAVGVPFVAVGVPTLVAALTMSTRGWWSTRSVGLAVLNWLSTRRLARLRQLRHHGVSGRRVLTGIALVVASITVAPVALWFALARSRRHGSEWSPSFGWILTARIVATSVILAVATLLVLLYVRMPGLVELFD
ncbi:MAG TPA: hypothetical protein VN045_06365 [Microbacteriaceae bacterium]|jgi:hypothetical protein|nr:hypothetical protein [Microbacteriaceae bacterium]